MVMEHFASTLQGTTDSLSPPSEPSSIRDWFPSYVYESLPFCTISSCQNSPVKEIESEVDQFSIGETDKENVGVAAPESKFVTKFGSYKDHKPENRRLSEIPEGKLSESLPSEPPDIGNWFSSYVYESPVLDISDGLAVSVPGESERVQEEVVARESKWQTEKTTELDKNNAFTLEIEHEPVSSAKVTDFSQSLSLVSEPPDVRNWFSSYAYESPQLSETYELGYASPEKDGIIIKESDVEEQMKFGIIRKTRSKEGIISSDRLKSNGYRENKSVSLHAKESFEEEEIRGSSDSAELDKNLEKKTLTRLLNGSTEELKQESSFNHKVSPCRLKQESSFNHEPFPCKPKQESSFSRRISPCIPKPLSNWNREALHGLKLEYLQETIIMNTRPESPRKANQRVSLDENFGATVLEPNDKENLHRESLETGFVTTKKDRLRGAREQSSKGKQDRGILIGCSRSKGSMRVTGEEDEENTKRRKVLGETTNFRSSGAMEITGRWRCPQNDKPNLDPALKQLRLDTWFRRL